MGRKTAVSQCTCPGHPLCMTMPMEPQEQMVNNVKSKEKELFFLLLKDITFLMMSVASKRPVCEVWRRMSFRNQGELVCSGFYKTF